jgi:asparagine synthase (glutamine-hydrolysing)
MLDTIQHRGRDNQGITTVYDDHIALGCDRLSIIDLSPAGNQPIMNEDGNIWIVMNGEIYNYMTLALDQDMWFKHSLRGKSDTEITLHAYETFGVEVFPELDGMFAIAIWDGQKKQLILARDRFGIKPLYWASVDGNIIFASEIKAILASGLLPSLTYNKSVIDDILTLDYQVTPGTILNEINMMEPGTIANFSLYAHTPVSISHYWAPHRPVNGAPAPELIRTYLESAISSQAIASDVPVGSFLSGGLDTSTIVALASKIRPIKTFCMGFGRADDEFADAELVAKHFGTEHYSLMIDPSDALKRYPDMIWHAECPKMNLYGWYIAEAAARHVKVVMSGIGGDELFCGYPTSLRFQRAFASTRPASPEAYLEDVLHHDRTEYSQHTADDLRPYFSGADLVQDVVRCEFHTKMSYDYLMTDDAMGMAHTLEYRLPFLDNGLVELMYPVPWRYQMTQQQGKLLLRESVKDLLPAHCFEKPKQGFSINVYEWWERGLGELAKKHLPDSQLLRGICPERYEYAMKYMDYNNTLAKRMCWLMLGLQLFDNMFLQGGEHEW